MLTIIASIVLKTTTRRFTLALTTHRVFISYHHEDEREVQNFIDRFDYERKVFTTRGLGQSMPGDVVDSTDTSYVMRRIRELYIKDASVTLVLIGKCTWARRYVDWEIQASLRHRDADPKGLLGIVLPSAKNNPIAPNRLKSNLGSNNNQAYANWHHYTQDAPELRSWIEAAYQARSTRKLLIENPRERFLHNKQCF